VAGALIAVSLLLQVFATTRVLCPPRSLPALAPLRVACAPRLWPFIDYPMFSEPHARGEELAWVDARIVARDGTCASTTSHEVEPASGETWASAYERTEAALRSALEPGLAERELHVAFARHRLVLAAGGLEPQRGDRACCGGGSQ
jgi:hypothetical protein